MHKDLTAYEQAMCVLPLSLREQAQTLPAPLQPMAEEIRLRLGTPMCVIAGEREYVLGAAITQGQLEQVLELGSQASLHTVLPQLRQGFITVAGGHRLGVCGSAVMCEGKLETISPLSAANLRIAHQVKGIASDLLAQIFSDGQLQSTLILAPPGLGKTTLLRDLVRCISDGENCTPLRVSLADERGEVAAMYRGLPQLEVGRRTDVMEGCEKAQALMLLLRAMNPQVLVTDEITAPEDVQALQLATGCGAAVLATAHGAGMGDLKRRPLYQSMLEMGIFTRLITIYKTGDKRRYEVEVLE